MTVRLIRIGNSHGVRIPKVLAEQADLFGRELELRLVNEGILVARAERPRQGWREQLEAMAAAGDDAPLLAEDAANDFDEGEWTWSPDSTSGG